MGYQQTNPDQNVFDVCLTVYRGCRDQIAYGRLGAVDASAFKQKQWRPDRKPRAEDYAADFARAGKEALNREGRHSRMVLFQFHYLGGAGYEETRRWLGLSEMGWVKWTEEIRTLVGQELVRRQIYPPEKYFEEFRAEKR
jgi:hypothetical protein